MIRQETGPTPEARIPRFGSGLFPCILAIPGPGRSGYRQSSVPRCGEAPDHGQQTSDALLGPYAQRASSMAPTGTASCPRADRATAGPGRKTSIR